MTILAATCAALAALGLAVVTLFAWSAPDV
jgi:hypothetical protein